MPSRPRACPGPGTSQLSGAPSSASRPHSGQPRRSANSAYSTIRIHSLGRETGWPLFLGPHRWRGHRFAVEAHESSRKAKDLPGRSPISQEDALRGLNRERRRITLRPRAWEERSDFHLSLGRAALSALQRPANGGSELAGNWPAARKGRTVTGSEQQVASGEALDAKSWRAQCPGQQDRRCCSRYWGNGLGWRRIGRGTGTGTARARHRAGTAGHSAGHRAGTARGTAGHGPGHGGERSRRCRLWRLCSLTASDREVAMPASIVESCTATSRAAAAESPAVVGVAGGVGTSTIAVALGGLDLGVFTGRRADVVVCRATVASVVRRASRCAVRAPGRRGHRRRLGEAEQRAAVAAGAAGAAHRRRGRPAVGAALA